MIDQRTRKEKDEPTLSIRIPGAGIADERAHEERAERDVVFETADLSVRYGSNVAVRGVSMKIEANDITALIGPSGCGKSTLIRCFNRMNDLIAGAVVSGNVIYRAHDLYEADVDPDEVRRRIG